jgi:hypothetical protein
MPTDDEVARFIHGGLPDMPASRPRPTDDNAVLHRTDARKNRGTGSEDPE